jgi:hypothetical protein
MLCFLFNFILSNCKSNVHIVKIFFVIDDLLDRRLIIAKKNVVSKI